MHRQGLACCARVAFGSSLRPRRRSCCAIGEPDVSFELHDGYSEEVGGESIRVVFPGAGHTSDNVVTWFPASGILFGGCMIKGGPDLGYLGDADLESYPAAAARVEALGARVVVSGHGDRFDAEQVAHTRALAEAARAAAHAAD
jgi:metallo-beta-lactamase class B